MAEIHWANAVSGSFEDANDWAGGVVPASGDDAILDAAGTTNYTVTVYGGPGINSIQTAVTATLVVLNGFFAENGTGDGVNAGTISIAGPDFQFEGELNNTGLIEIGTPAEPGFSDLSSQATNASLAGGGKVAMNSGIYTIQSNGLIGGHASEISGDGVLINVNNTISGSGLITGGDGFPQTLTLVNEAAGSSTAYRSTPDPTPSPTPA
jgi:hypothetical protein